METGLGPCINGVGFVKPDGYVFQRFKGKQVYAHRLAYCQGAGITLESIRGLVVRHRCDNRACVRTDHLELGTQKDNMRDMVRRGRQLRGERANAAKLTDQDVLAIRAMYVFGCRVYGLSALARRFSVAKQTIWKIVQGQAWSHVT